MLTVSSNDIESFNAIDEQIKKAEAIEYAKQSALDIVGFAIDSFGLIKDAEISNLERLIPTPDTLKKLDKIKSVKGMLDNVSAVLTAFGGITTAADLLITQTTLKESKNCYNSAVDNLLENYSP